MKPCKFTSRRSLLAISSALAGLAGWSTARAEAVGAASAPAVAEIVVTGQRAMNRNAINVRRQSDQLVDSATSDEIGQLPDFNAGDALKRLPGVNVVLYQGEPRFVSIRGASANYTTVNIDGLTMATPDSGGRQVYMEMLPSSLAARIDVSKTSTAAMDGHGLGGVVNFVSAGAFDFPGATTLISAKAGVNFQQDRYGGKTTVGEAEARRVFRFGAEDQFGLTVGASHWMRDIYIPQLSPAPGIGFYDAAGAPVTTPYGGNGYLVPLARQWFNYDNKRDRSGLNARLDWRPNDALSAQVSSFYYLQHEDADRNDATASIAATGRVTNQTPSSGVLSGGSHYYQLARLRFTRELYGANGAIGRRFDNGFQANLRAGWSRATLSNPQTFDRLNQSGLSFAYDMSSGLPVFTATDLAKYANLSLYKLQDRREQMIELEQDVIDVQGDLARNMGPDAEGLGFKLGFKLVNTTQANTASIITYTKGTYSLADVASGASICSIDCNQGGIVLIDAARADQVFAANRATMTVSDSAATRYGGTYDVDEKIYSGFAMAQYAAAWGKVIAGLRLEATDFSSNGNLQTSGVWQAASSGADYSDLLPSLTVNLNTGEASLLRAAYSRTIGRPRFDAMAVRGGVLNTGVTPYTLSQGNTALRPQRSENLDLSHEWYFGGGRGMLSIGVFHKRISDANFNFGQSETMTVNGVASEVLVTQNRNTESDVTVKGMELSLTRDFDFLPAPFDGLGVTANATISQTRFPVTLRDGSKVTINSMPQQANRMYNVAFYYEKGRVRARVAWNHTGTLWDDRFSFLTSRSVFYQNRYVEPTNYVDASVSYAVTDGLTLSLTGQNLTGQDYNYLFGRSQEAYHDKIGFSPSVLAGLNFRF